MIPVADLKVIIEYLRGQGGHTIKCVAQSVVALLGWAVDMIPGDHPHPLFASVDNLVDDPAGLLETLVPAEGVTAAGKVPDWLIPLLFSLLKKLLMA